MFVEISLADPRTRVTVGHECGLGIWYLVSSLSIGVAPSGPEQTGYQTSRGCARATERAWHGQPDSKEAQTDLQGGTGYEIQGWRKRTVGEDTSKTYGEERALTAQESEMRSDGGGWDGSECRLVFIPNASA